MILANYQTQWLLEALKYSPEWKYIPHIQSCLDVGFRPYLALNMDQTTRNISYVLVIGYVFPMQRTVDSLLNSEHVLEDHMLILRGATFRKHGFEICTIKYSGHSSVLPCDKHYPPLFTTKELDKFFGQWIVDGLMQHAESTSSEIEHVMDTVFESTSMSFPFNSGMENLYRNYYFWLERYRWMSKIKNDHQLELDTVNDTLNELRALIAGRIQRDGNKTLFKAKHFVDLPKDFADKLLPLLNILGE